MSSASQDITLFTAVDRSGDPGFFAEFLERGNRVPAVAASKPVLLDALRLQPGQRVLDAGCGTGADVVDLAHRVGAGGTVVGVDISEALIGEARRRVAQAEGIEATVDLVVGDSQRLDFDDESFDAVRSERMLMHVPDAEAAVGELVRVTRRGGRLAVFDFDWDTMIVDSPDRETTRDIVRSFSDSMKNGWIGRRLPRMFRSRGVVDLSVDSRQVWIDYAFAELLLGGHLVRAQQAGVIAPAQAAEWWRHLEAADRAGDFLLGFTAFIVSGTRS